MARHSHGALADIHEYVSIKHHHNHKGHQVEDGPEDEVRVAVEGCHVGAGFDGTDTVPAHAWDSTHYNGHSPDDYYDHHHTPVTHASVKLHAEDCDVALNGDG